MFASRRTVLVTAGAAVAAVAVVVAALLLSGGDPSAGPADGPTPLVVQPGAPGQPGRTLSPEELAALSPPAFAAADTMFMQRMIPHHAQALEMTALVAGRTTSTDIPLLAQRIAVSQQDEIAQMQRWFADRRIPPPTPHANHAGHGSLMPGMLDATQLDALERARGAAFDRLFLELMIGHHEGALTMVRELYATGGGLEPATDRFAREVNADQAIEINRMREMLANRTG